MRVASDRHCERSEATQFAGSGKGMDCFGFASQ
jgi:hypothetical protein